MYSYSLSGEGDITFDQIATALIEKAVNFIFNIPLLGPILEKIGIADLVNKIRVIGVPIVSNVLVSQVKDVSVFKGLKPNSINDLSIVFSYMIIEAMYNEGFLFGNDPNEDNYYDPNNKTGRLYFTLLQTTLQQVISDSMKSVIEELLGEFPEEGPPDLDFDGDEEPPSPPPSPGWKPSIPIPGLRPGFKVPVITPPKKPIPTPVLLGVAGLAAFLLLT